MLEETVNDGEGSSQFFSKSYVLGHDVIGQFDLTNGISYMMYDGHGSTRALYDPWAWLQDSLNGPIARNASNVGQVFAYDAYGNLLAGPGLATMDDAITTLLYSGEQTDGTGLQFLRARYYDSASGRFNRLDPFGGNFDDPQSLHKYLYAHADPVNGIDPSGEGLIQNSIEALDEALVAIRLAGAAYAGYTSPFPPGWRPNGINNQPNIGFRAIIIDNPAKRERVVAFAGTDDLILAGQFGDLVANFNQGTAQISAQYEAALAYAATAKASLPSGWTLKFTGHSLGGGLASLAGAKYRVPTITFNPAPLRLRTLQRYGTSRGDLTRQVISYQVQGEALTTAANATGTPALGFGLVYDLPAQPGLDPWGLHGRGAIEWGINDLRNAELSGLGAESRFDGYQPGNQGRMLQELIRDGVISLE